MEEITQLMIKELDVARDLYKEQRAIQDKYSKMFGAIIVALLTFVIRGDLPEKIYLVIAAVELIGAIIILRISYRKRCNGGLYIISERKLAKHLKTQYPEYDLFNLVPYRKYLRDAYPKKSKAKEWVNLILLISFLSSYFYFIIQGLSAYALSNNAYWMLIVLSAIVLIVFIISSVKINSSQKLRFARAMDELGLDMKI